MRKLNLGIKRCIDIIGSILGLIILSPLLIVVSVLIKITAPGPIFFRQERLGYKGYEGYQERAKKRFDMRPGMTGLAQAKVRNSATWDERIVYDVEYVEKFNVFFDISILIQTVFTVLNSKNIYANN